VNKPDSYEDVMKELEEINELLELKVDSDESDLYNGDFRFEYAHESLTEKHTAYKRRTSHV